MRKVFIHAGIATLISIAVSLAICWTALTAVGGRLDTFAAAMCVICPLAVAFPASAYTYNQKRKLALVHEALTAAHEELATVHRQLAEKARLDDMTGLLNRSAFVADIEETRGKAKRGSMILIDADNFKQINDTYGHLVGDTALMAIAGAIRDATRDADVKGRLGGEEFGVFIAGADLEEARQAAERVRKAVEVAPFRPMEHDLVRLTVSIAVVEAERAAS
jgi:diguanylate cyclase (GGDEF)-like protein